MKKIGLLGISFLFSLALLAQKQVNDPLAQVRKVSGFHAIRVSTGIKLYLSQGPEAVAVSASKEEFRDRIITKVENGVLKIYYEEETLKFWKNRGGTRGKNPVAYVSIENIDDLHVNAGASVSLEGELKGNKLNLDVSSGASFKGEVNFSTLTVDQSSGSVVTISGTAGSLSVEGSSGSMFHGYELTASTCDADVSSGAGIQITMNKEMSAEASSGGYVSYKGSGVIRNVRTSSGGSVSKKG